MVFMVKIPSRSRATTPEPDGLRPVVAVVDGHDSSSNIEESTLTTTPAAALDVLLAPSVLQHRYVRGVDKSLIVERPERIRAVLLGIAAAIGKAGSTSTQPPLPSDEDDLVAKLGNLSVNNNEQQHRRVRVLHSTRSLALDPPHPAVAFTHAHHEDQVALIESAFQQAKQKRQQIRQQSDALPDPALPAAAMNDDRESTPMPIPAPMSTTPVLTSHAAYLEHLCRQAPNQPPQAEKPSRPRQSSKAEDSEAYTSPDGEGDKAIFPSEIPDHLPQGDLYLAGPSTEADKDGGSAEAIRHAMGACCEAVDRVVAATTASGCSPLAEVNHDAAAAATGPHAPAKRVFVLSRPPGHHCAGSTPSGFCWVNNAVVASAHAYLTHSIDRVVVLDIDLHHGNGTQTLAWRINADANKHDDARFERLSSLRHAALDRLRAANRRGARVALSEQDDANIQIEGGKRALRMFYGSIHDIESYPCEDGDAGLVRDASTCVEGAHGQWIWNIHLDTHASEQDFVRLYQTKYSALFAKAARFLTATKATPERTLVLISAGFDACSYEYPGMQRHGKSVPPSFYHTFARDTVAFSEQWAQGKLISVLEGGYSDRALCSAAMAHVTGLSTNTDSEAEHEHWKLENLIAIEKMAKKMAANAAAASAGPTGINTTPKRRQAELPPWLTLTSKAFAAFEQACGKQNIVPIGTPITGSGRDTSEQPSAFNSPATTARVLRNRKSRMDLNTPDNATPVQGTRKTATPASSPLKKKGVKKESALQTSYPWTTAPEPPLPEPVAATDVSPTKDASMKDEPSISVNRVSEYSPLVWSPSEVISPATDPSSASRIHLERSHDSFMSFMSLSDGGMHYPPFRGDQMSPENEQESRLGSQTPIHRGLNAHSVTLMDAMSSVHIVDRNTLNIEDNGRLIDHVESQMVSSDGRSSLGVGAFDEDAPGSPDPQYAPRIRSPISTGNSSELRNSSSPPFDDFSNPASPPRRSEALYPSSSERQQRQDALYSSIPLPIPPMRFSPHSPPNRPA